MENGISEAEVAKYIVSEIVFKDVKDMELKRAKQRIYNINNVMKKQARGEVVKKTNIDDEITALYMGRLQGRAWCKGKECTDLSGTKH